MIRLVVGMMGCRDTRGREWRGSKLVGGRGGWIHFSFVVVFVVCCVSACLFYRNIPDVCKLKIYMYNFIY